MTPTQTAGRTSSMRKERGKRIKEKGLERDEEMEG
jgi:hypothetical protein